MSLLLSTFLIYIDYRSKWFTMLLNTSHIEFYTIFVFLYLSLNSKHLRGTTYRKNNSLVNYKIAGASKFCILFLFYSIMIKMLNIINIYNININIDILNSLFFLYLPYYISFPEYTGEKRIIMPSYFHSIVNKMFSIFGKYRLINESVKLNNVDKNGKPYIIGVHPHGLFPFGSVGSLALPNNLKYMEETTPILNTKYLKAGIASFCFYIPFMREIFLWLGAVDCSKPILKKFLEKGITVAVFIGGAQEAQYSGIGSTQLVLKSRNGFFKLALETGCTLVPMYTFGNNNIFNSVNWDIFGLLAYFKKITGIWFPRGYFTMKQNDFITVIGEPIEVEKIQMGDDINVSLEMLKDKYMKSLTQLFDKYKYLDPYCANKSLEYI